MLALVDEVKRQLDAARQPDGFNVGFNVGAAAGQTVGHLHVEGCTGLQVEEPPQDPPDRRKFCG
jgi:hypothetical protein